MIAISAGIGHSLALRSDGTVYGWGLNSSGQLGVGNTNNSGLPVQMLKGESGDSEDHLEGFNTTDYIQHVVGISAGEDHSLVLVRIEETSATGSGIRTEVYAMGNNSMGQLGIWSRDNGTSNYVPRRVRGPVDTITGKPQPDKLGSTGEGTDEDIIVQVLAAQRRSYAITQTGKTYGWGNNFRNALNVMDETTSYTQAALDDSSFILPTLMVDMGNIRTLAVGYDYSINWGSDRYPNYRTYFNGAYVKEDGTVWAWGYGRDYAFGTTEGYEHLYPVRVGAQDMNLLVTDWVYVDAAQHGLGTGVVRINEGETVYIHLSDLKNQYLSGFNLYDRNGKSDLTSVDQLEAVVMDERVLTATLDTTSQVVAFKPTGEMGSTAVALTYRDGEETYVLTLNIYVRRLESAKSSDAEQRTESDVAVPMISTQASHSIALKADGTVWTWGYGYTGQSGDGTNNSYTFPSPVLAPEEEDRLICDTCGVTFNSGSVGDNCQIDTCAGHLEVNYFHNIVAVAAGGSGINNAFNLALDADGNVWAWGNDSNIVPGGKAAYLPKKVDFSRSYNEDNTQIELYTPFIVAISAGANHA